MLPFVVCFIVLISHIENVIALICEDYVCYNDEFILNTPLSFAIACQIKYDWLILALITIISFAIETCIYNKLACCYLWLNLLEKSYYATHEHENYIYYIVIVLNIIVSAYFVYKGIRMIK